MPMALLLKYAAVLFIFRFLHICPHKAHTLFIRHICKGVISMRLVLTFLRAHGYALFVALLVLLLGITARQLRRTREPAPVSVPVSLPPQATVSPSPAPTTAAAAIPAWHRPVSGGILTPYAGDHPQWNAAMDCWETHAGIDFAASAGDTVHAAADGIVSEIFDDPLLGLTLCIIHADEYQTLYASLASTLLAPGQTVRAGESVGIAGDSADSESLMGVHLHFELLQDSLPVKPFFSS